MNKSKFNQNSLQFAFLILFVFIVSVLSSCGNQQQSSSNYEENKENVFLEKKSSKSSEVYTESAPPPPPPPPAPSRYSIENEVVYDEMEVIEHAEEILFDKDELSESADMDITEESVTHYNPKKTQPKNKERLTPNKNQRAETYQQLVENSFKNASEHQLSTFSIDVDNAAYANVRRYLTSYNQLPPKDAVRIEEMINYFDYDYPSPIDKHPFSVYTELGECPWSRDHQLVHIGIQGKRLDYENLKSSNLVFLIDASGSMSAQNKLPLLKKSFEKLLNNLGDNDRVAIVAYAGAAGLVLPSTPASNKRRILSALNSLSSGGSTAGGAGIQLAYKIALENFIDEGNNRIILATDGDFNVGTTNNVRLVDLVEEKRKSGVYLTICGFGMGNYKDDRMEMISNAGNGNYFYIDNLREAEKVFVKDMRANMFTLAKDVKIQVEFNPNLVKSYRLIGYENRVLANRDFNDDTKDAGELGAGHSVTALYEIVPVDKNLKYGKKSFFDFSSNEILSVKLRYKPEDKEKSILIDNTAVKYRENIHLSDKFRFSASVAGFGLLLKNSNYINHQYSFENVLEWAETASATDTYKREFVDLVKKAARLKSNERHSWQY